MDSILNSTKKLLGIPTEYDHFDIDIMMHINAVFMTLQQLGVGPANGFMISDEYTTWDQFMTEGPALNTVKSYMGLKVQMLFDPPSSGTIMEARKTMIAEYEWRLNLAAETPQKDGEEDELNVSYPF